MSRTAQTGEDLIQKKCRQKKRLMVLALILSTVVFVFVSMRLIAKSLDNLLQPQITRAMIRVTGLLPELEANEEALRTVYGQMNESRSVLLEREGAKDKHQAEEQEFKNLLQNTLSWRGRVSRLKVGRDGFVMVVAEDGTILSHPEDGMIGQVIRLDDEVMIEGSFLGLNDIRSAAERGKLSLKMTFFAPNYSNEQFNMTVVDYFHNMLYGCALQYRGTYIVCGVSIREMFSYLARRCLVVSLLYLCFIWIFMRYARMHLGWRREEPARLRMKLLSFGMITAVIVWAFAWYSLVLSYMTEDLNTMDVHADLAVDNLNDYELQKKAIGDWLDRQYLIQCRLAADMVQRIGRDNLTRAQLADYAENLGVEDIYVFDRNGRVVVTDGPYDHFQISDDPGDQSYLFRQLLDGEDHVVQAPMRNDTTGTLMQYVGVCIRDEQDLSDGFVQIAIDPSLRESLVSPLSVETVLSDLTIGLPQEAIAVDREKGTIAVTTGIGYVGQPVADLQISQADLMDDVSGLLLRFGRQNYNAGVSGSRDYYLIPMVRRSNSLTPFRIAFWMGFITLVTCLIMSFLTLSGYEALPQRRKEEAGHFYDVDEDLNGENPVNDGSVTTAAAGTESEQAAQEGQHPDTDWAEEKNSLWQKLADITDFQEKQDMDVRWNISRVAAEEQTPEMKCRQVIFRVLILFCIAVIISKVIAGQLGSGGGGILAGSLTYVTGSNWKKGINIFAFTSCMLLLCELYVAYVILDRILYQIARITDMSAETICLLIRTSLKYISVVIFVYFGLSEFGVDTRTLVASAGLMTLIISMGARDLMSDFLAGFFQIFEGTIKVGDFIEVDGWYGTVQQVGLRTTKVRFYSDTRIFSNSNLRNLVIQGSSMSRVLIKMPMPRKTDLLALEEFLNRELPALRQALPEGTSAPKYGGIESLDDNKMVIRIFVFCPPARRKAVTRALNRELKLLFDNNESLFGTSSKQ